MLVLEGGRGTAKSRCRFGRALVSRRASLARLLPGCRRGVGDKSWRAVRSKRCSARAPSRLQCGGVLRPGTPHWNAAYPPEGERRRENLIKWCRVSAARCERADCSVAGHVGRRLVVRQDIVVLDKRRCRLLCASSLTTFPTTPQKSIPPRFSTRHAIYAPCSPPWTCL